MGGAGGLGGPASGRKASRAARWRQARGAAALLALVAIVAGAPARADNGAGKAVAVGDNLEQIQRYYDSIVNKVPGGLPQAPDLRAAVEQARHKAVEMLGAGEGDNGPAGTVPANPSFRRMASALARRALGEAPEPGERDPFSVTRRLERIAQNGSAQALDFVSGFDPEEKLPKMRLRGLLKKGNEAIALLDIEGVGIHVVREGDAVGLHQMGVNNVIKIVKFDELSLVVEAGSFGQMFIVR